MKNVAFITHQASLYYFGGVEAQLCHLHYIINNTNGGYKAHYFNMWEDKIDDYDILHFFNPYFMAHEAKMIAEKAITLDIPVVTKPVFTFHRGAFHIIGNGVFSSLLEKIFFSFRRGIIPTKYMSFIDPFFNLSSFFELCDKILCTSTTEKNNLVSLLNIKGDTIDIVPNGVDTRFQHGDKTLFADIIKAEDYILYVGRIEPIKNVLSLLKAYSASNISSKLVIVGNHTNKSYSQLCYKAANEKVIFYPHISHNSPLLCSAYAGAKVFALPSYYETCGTAGLEAGLAGANVVVTEKGGTKDYYRDYAYYVDPYCIDSIKNGLIRAFYAEKSGELGKHVASSYCWDTVRNIIFSQYNSLWE